MRSRTRRWAAIGLLAAVTLAGCSGGDQDTSTAEPAEDAMQADDGGRAGGGEAGDGAAADSAAPDEQEQADRDDGGDASVEVGGETAGRQVIRRAHVALASDDPEQTVDDIGEATEGAGGFVAGTDLHREGGVLAGTVTLRVPADELSDTLTRIEAAGVEVRSRQLSSEDVTGEVTDIESQLRNLRALETELLELLSDARETGDTEQVLAVFDRIRETRDEIERLEGRRANLDDLVSLATIEVRIEPTDALLLQTAPERDPEPGPWSPSQQVERAWNATLGALQGVADGAIVLLVTVLPITLVVAVPLLLVVLAVRAARGRRASAGPPPGDGGDPAGPPDTPPQPVGAAAVPSSEPDRD